MTQQTFKVTGMHCVSCAMNLEGALEDVQGVASANAQYAQSVVVVAFDERQVTPVQLAQAAEGVGYQLHPAS